MAQPLTLEDGIGRKELVAIQRRFTDLQSQRLQRILEDLLPAQQVFMQVLPLLLHINHPLLPGYVTDETAAGIVDYTPDRETLRAAQRLSRTFRYRRQALKRPLIHALYLIGDNGSLGATRHQGIEVWLCHDATLAEAGLNELERKCERIQEWGRELRLKVEIRMLPVDRVSHHPDSPLAVTSPPLLLEEFYRNGLLLAGLPPLWWLIPPEHEVEYRHYAQMLIARRFVSPQDCLDFGGLEVYSSEELFTAALHRLDEGIDRPYDALLQMLLMERYLRDHPTPSWVSWEMKKAVYAGETGADALDPYLLLYLHLERHLQALGHPHRLELVRRTLYFRSGVCLSRPRNIGWRHRLMRGLTQEWGWDDARLRMLDQRREWKTARVMRERDLLLQELSNAYRLLTSLGRRQADGRTRSTRKLRLLGRKLYARWD
ncbi:MAG TPA: adenylate cyclase, partial [Chromatiales bacterium]|nr:adenylate cyclase [Chromatiales bacterium]